ncbi:MAG TPA: sulfite exporter TauE/SafE family protein [Acetobacteraceae bacterium]|nr:sulfite exporter TauE/SafE family protein [Acetobacteraceae bacterium]
MPASLPLLGSLCSPQALHGGLLVGLFLAGATGSTMHCVPMCGGFVLGQVADSLTRLPAARLCEWQRVRAGLLLPYHLGRLTTYAALGALAASATAALLHGTWFPRLSAALLALAAAIFGAQALGRLRSNGTGTFGRAIARLGVRLNGGRMANHYALGLLLGLLPCGFVYGALTAAAASGSAATGAAAMLAFGLGTAPALIAVGIAGQAAGHRWRQGLARLGPAVMAANAALLLGLALTDLAAT